MSDRRLIRLAKTVAIAIGSLGMAHAVYGQSLTPGVALSPALSAPSATVSASLTETEARLLRDGAVSLEVGAGKTVQLFGNGFHASENAQVYATLSSSFLSIAVLSGRLDAAGQTARPGNLLIVPIDGRSVTRLMFDAAVLARTLPRKTATRLAPLLDPIAAQQRRLRQFGLIEPVGVNVQAPRSAAAETIERSYLNEPAIIDIRRRAAGDRAKQRRLTVDRFIEAVAAHDDATVASLIDPKPFTNSSTDPTVWKPARLAFAQSVTAQHRLIEALADPSVTVAADGGNATIGAKTRVSLVERNRAVFVAAVEDVK